MAPPLGPQASTIQEWARAPTIPVAVKQAIADIAGRAEGCAGEKSANSEPRCKIPRCARRHWVFSEA